MQYIDDFFKDKLGGERLTPSEAAWQKIAQSGIIGKKQHKGMFFIFHNQYNKYAAAIALLLIAGSGWWIVNQDVSSSSENLPLVENIQENKSTEMKDIQTNTQNMTPEKELVHATNAYTQGNVGVRHESSKIDKTQLKNESSVASIAHTSISALPVLRQNVKTRPVNLPSVQLHDTEEWYDDDYRYFTAEELMYAADQLDDVEVQEEQELGLKQRLFKKAKNTLTDWAETAGVPLRQIGGISQIEILY
jgi:hypothetical protein